ncbi:hypothetical protein BJ944DRAFT_266855 [Cunninghamella echinulata]|nr:hypothetical protein BJ944DRAFT_266855 [Cunninghamella echinulata]
MTDQDNCTHEVVFNQICVFCGKDVEFEHDNNEKQVEIISAAGLKLSKTEADRLERENTLRLLKERKLILVVDLDQTIIHVTCERKDTSNNSIEPTEDIRRFELNESEYIYYLKLRPGLQDILKKLSKIYELYVYTMGTRQYAQAVLHEIDPNSVFFQGRIMSREENKQKSLSDKGSEFKKTLDRLFSCEKSMVAIIDDRFDVWDFSPHLVHVKPYFFFKGTGDINNPFIKNKQQAIADNPKKTTIQFNKDDDKEMFDKFDMLSKIHDKFYQDYDLTIEKNGAITLSTENIYEKLPNITDYIDNFRIHVFKGLHIAFSDKDPKSSYYWKIAELYGAKCYNSLSSKITHLVTGVPGIDMIDEAVNNFPKINIINPFWLYDSITFQGTQNEGLERYLMDRFKNIPDRMNGSEFIANPESTLLDLDSYSFEDNRLSLDTINWDEADQEVEDFLNDSDSSDESGSESGSSSSDSSSDDSSSDEKSTKSDDEDINNNANTKSRIKSIKKKLKRKQIDNDDDISSDNHTSTNVNKKLKTKDLNSSSSSTSDGQMKTDGDNTDNSNNKSNTNLHSESIKENLKRKRTDDYSEDDRNEKDNTEPSSER